MLVRSPDARPKGDREGQCGRGGQVVELGCRNSDKFATSPHLHGGAICPHGREFFEFSESVNTVSKFRDRGRMGEASNLPKSVADTSSRVSHTSCARDC